MGGVSGRRGAKREERNLLSDSEKNSDSDDKKKAIAVALAHELADDRPPKVVAGGKTILLNFPTISGANPIMPGETIRIFDLPLTPVDGLLRVDFHLLLDQGVSVDTRIAVDMIPNDTIIEEVTNTPEGVAAARLIFLTAHPAYY